MRSEDKKNTARSVCVALLRIGQRRKGRADNGRYRSSGAANVKRDRFFGSDRR